MSDNVDALLGVEDDVGDYDLREEEEDALLEDDGYEQSREINSVQEDELEQGFDESGDVLELSVDGLLNEDEENDFNDSYTDGTPRDKFNRERKEMPSSSSGSNVPDTTTKITRKPMGGYQRGGVHSGRGRFPPSGALRGSFRGGMRGQGSQRGYQNVQNRNARPRQEAWVRKPMQIQPWDNRPQTSANYQPQPSQQPLLQTPKPWIYQYQNQTPSIPQVNKPSIHERLGYNNQQPPHQHQQQQPQVPQYQQQQPVQQQFMHPPPMQVQQPQQISFEQDRFITSHPIQVSPQQNYNQPQQYSQPPPVYNQAPQTQYSVQNTYQPPSNNYQNNYVQPPVQQHQPHNQQQYSSQYNSDPYIQLQTQPQQQQVVFQKDFYEPPPADNYNNGNDAYNQQGYNNYNTPQTFNTRNQEPAFNARNQELTYNTRNQEQTYNTRNQEPAFNIRNQEVAYNTRNHELAFNTRNHDSTFNMRNQEPFFSARNQEPQPQYGQPRIIRTNSMMSPPSPHKRRMEFRKPFVEKEVVHNKQRKVFENKNLHEVKTVENFENVKPVPTSTFTVDPKPIPDDEDEETKKYRLQIEKQKKIREELLARKEERRKLAAQKKQVEEAMKTIPSPQELIKPCPVAPVPTIPPKKPLINRTLINKPQPQKALNTNPNLRVVNAANTAEKDQIKAFLSNRKIIAKDESLLQTSIVVVSNLAAGTSEVKLRKICSGVGDIQKIELSPKERQATIQFNSVASAHAFYKKYQRFMLDLSMIKVTLKPLSL